jgi:malate dehydrogenase (oxaloacetate-decarboxylating)(NADP+)
MSGMADGGERRSTDRRLTSGFGILNDPTRNKSMAFTQEERDEYRLRGLLPAKVFSQDMQLERVLENMKRKSDDIERYIFLYSLQGRNERLYYRTIIEHIDDMMPIVYTPTVGEACRQFAHIFRETRGFYVTPDDRGSIRDMLNNWPDPDVRVIVMTDGERILGLGDLGANGMGIPIGKLALYTACAGIDPKHCLPVQIDVGTDNESLLEDNLYLGVPSKRLRGDAYFELIDEFIEAVQDAYPRALIQFEDFITPNAYELLNRYRDQVLCFNDDIQGTAAVALAGVYAANRITGADFSDQRIMFLGAGSAATGIADLMTHALMRRGLSESEARHALWFVDTDGLVVSGRQDLRSHNLPYAHEHEHLDFIPALKALKPSVLIGATGHPGTFTKGVVEVMSSLNERPVIFALSNPTSRAECTGEQAFEWSDGRAVFATGSPFPPIAREDGTTWRPAQGNNAYVFPGIGLGVITCEATTVSDGMFLVAAEALAGEVSDADLAEGAVYPPLRRIREVSLTIAVAVAEEAYRAGIAQVPRPPSLRDHIAALMYDPTY